MYERKLEIKKKKHVLIISNSFLNPYIGKRLYVVMFVMGMYFNNLIPHYELAKSFDNQMEQG